jgi:hypothetical protein
LALITFILFLPQTIFYKINKKSGVLLGKSRFLSADPLSAPVADKKVVSILYPNPLDGLSTRDLFQLPKQNRNYSNPDNARRAER